MRILVLELKDQDSPIFDKIMEVVKCCPDIEYMKIKDEPVLSLPGLEIYPGRRKIYRDRREINLTAKEYNLSACLWRTKGRCLHMNRYTVRYGVRMRSAMKANKYYNSGLRKSGCCYFFYRL